MSINRVHEETYRRKIRTPNGRLSVVVYEGENDYLGWHSDAEERLPHTVVEMDFRTRHCRDSFVFSANPLTDLEHEMKKDLKNLDSLIESLEHARFRLREAADRNGIELPDLTPPEVVHQTEEPAVHDAKVGDVYVHVDSHVENGSHHVVVVGEYKDGDLDLFETRLGTAHKGQLDISKYHLVHRIVDGQPSSED